MKLESLNNPKYSLTPEKMGELVGGEAHSECSSGGYEYLGYTISADYVTYNEDGEVTTNERYHGAEDVSRRDTDHPDCVNCDCFLGK